MRFASRYGRFGVQVRPMIQEAYATGMAKVIQEPLYANFEPWLLQPHERELALNHWSFNGFYQQEDQVHAVPPDYRIGVYDSVIDQQAKGWPDEIRIEVERVLMANAAMTDNMLVLPMVVLTPPWPRYDDYTGTPRALLRKLVDEGHDLDAVLEYEQMNQNRDEVIEGLQQLLAGGPVEQEEEADVVLG